MRKFFHGSLFGAVALVAAACGGQSSVPGGGTDPLNPPEGAAGTSGSQDPNVGNMPGGGAGGGNLGNAPEVENPATLDPGRVGLRRLSDTEYNNTVRDLLGTTLRPAEGNVEEALGFDNNASAAAVGESQLDRYLTWGEELMAELFADPARLASVVSCQPAAPGDVACAAQVVGTFGERAWRRPLVQEEVTDLTGLYTAALELGQDHTQAMRVVLEAMLASPHFLYRIEFDADPAALTPHSLTSWEVATRLSYFLWSTMPDEPLAAVARSGELLNPAVVEAQVDRMLADGKASELVTNFAGQWLGMKDLVNHPVDPAAFPIWDDALRASMIAEANAYFFEFLSTDTPFSQFITADFNFVDARLAEHYGFTAPAQGTERISNTTDNRRGFLGLGAFLTNSSFSRRTSPTLRAKWVLESLLCSPPPPPPLNLEIPELEDTQEAASQIENVRERLAVHRTNPVCAGCHENLDPIGLGLENFDGIGQFRTAYGNGDVVDASGTLKTPTIPDGAPFTDLLSLSEIVGNDPRLLDCTREHLFHFAVGRATDATDAPYMDQLDTTWAAGGHTLKSLIKQIVLNDTFTHRRGEAEPAGQL